MGAEDSLLLMACALAALTVAIVLLVAIFWPSNWEDED